MMLHAMKDPTTVHPSHAAPGTELPVCATGPSHEISDIQAEMSCVRPKADIPWPPVYVLLAAEDVPITQAVFTLLVKLTNNA
jgi:hypothetical protein